MTYVSEVSAAHRREVSSRLRVCVCVPLSRCKVFSRDDERGVRQPSSDHLRLRSRRDCCTTKGAWDMRVYGYILKPNIGRFHFLL